MRISDVIYDYLNDYLNSLTRILAPFYAKVAPGARVLVPIILMLASAIYIVMIIDYALQAWTTAGTEGVDAILQSTGQRFTALFFFALLIGNILLLASWCRYWRNCSRWASL